MGTTVARPPIDLDPRCWGWVAHSGRRRRPAGRPPKLASPSFTLERMGHGTLSSVICDVPADRHTPPEPGLAGRVEAARGARRHLARERRATRLQPTEGCLLTGSAIQSVFRWST